MNIDIFDDAYSKKIFILGVAETEAKIFSDVTNICTVIYLISHENKYQVSISGLKGMETSLLDVFVEKVDRFDVLNNASYYKYQRDNKVGVPLEICMMSNRIIYSPENKMVNDMLEKFLDVYYDKINSLDNFRIIATDAFVLLYSPHSKSNYYGYLTLNDKSLFWVDKDEFEDILKMDKNKNEVEIDEQISF